jgi:hypothetical protein
MTTPDPGENPSGGAADDWISGKRRFDQIAYDSFGIKDKLAGKTWLATWAGHMYKRDRTTDEARAKIFKWIAVDFAMGYWLEKKYPKFLATFAIKGRMWPMYGLYMYGKNTASFNTLFLTGVDSFARSYVTTTAEAYRAMGKGEFPPPK